MFTGGDSTGEFINCLPQMETPQANSQSGAACSIRTAAASGAGSIDWAQLAQQWIQMRDCSRLDNDGELIPEAPPPPRISAEYLQHAKSINNSSRRKPKYEEHGMADMEMDDEEHQQSNFAAAAARHPMHLMPVVPVSPSNSLPPPMRGVIPTPVYTPPANWYMQPPALRPPTAVSGASDVVLPLPTETHAAAAEVKWQAWLPPVAVNPIASTACNSAGQQLPHIPSLMKLNVPDPHVLARTDKIDESNATITMDAAKRKILPAWIREGLEKMEREKQRQLERQQPNSIMDSTTLLDDDKPTVPRIAAQINLAQTTSTVKKLNKLMDSTESESSGNEDVGDGTTEDAKQQQNLETNDQARLPNLNYEQRLGDVMIAVRRTLTELLLEVTNEQISSIAAETLKSMQRKGLTAYADSGTEDSSDEESERASSPETQTDSEEELKAQIIAKRCAFVSISQKIEDELAECAHREEQKLAEYAQLENDSLAEQQQQQMDDANTLQSGEPLNASFASHASKTSPERKFGETNSNTKLHKANVKRQKERTTRFSDNKDSKSCIILQNNYTLQTGTADAAAKARYLAASVSESPSSKTLSPSQAADVQLAANASCSVDREIFPGFYKRRAVPQQEENKWCKERHKTEDATSKRGYSSENASSHSSRSSAAKRKRQRKRSRSPTSSKRSSYDEEKRSRHHKSSRDSDKKSRHHRHHYTSDEDEDSSDDDRRSSKKYRSHKSTSQRRSSSSSHRSRRHSSKSRSTHSRTKSRSRSRSTYTKSRRRH